MTARFRKRPKGGASTLSPFAAPVILPSLAAKAPSDRITIGIIGTGAQGFKLLRRFLAQAGAQVVAVCDVNRASYGYKDESQQLGREPAQHAVNEHYGKRTKSGSCSACTAYNDFRELVGRQDIDAVVIATPDHWHAVMTVTAARAGKDIYCETPLSLTVRQGQQMVQAVRKHQRILQTGSDQRSNPAARLACELLGKGEIGQVQRITSSIGPVDKVGPGPGWQPAPVPDGFDYDLWLGPAHEAPHHPDRCLHYFRFNYDYSGGQVASHGSHWNDIAQWALGTDESGPVEVECQNAKFLPEGSLFNAATETVFRCRYAKGVDLICETSNSFAGVRFEGTDGTLEVGCRGLITEHPTSKRSENRRVNVHYSEREADEARQCGREGHVRNFLDCVRTRSEPAAPVGAGHRSASVCHVGNIAVRLWKEGKKKILRWDPRQERFGNDDEANAMLTCPMRKPWRL